MLALTDDPARPGQLLPRGSTWRRQPLRSLAPADQLLWRALGQGRPLWRAELSPEHGGGFWSRLVLIDEAPGSQFDALRDLFRAQQKLSGPVACLALTGRSFHGHRDRPWVAERGNLHLAAGVRLVEPATRVLPGLTMLPAVATTQTVQRATDGAVLPRIKWVNDVLVGGRKIAGVLTTSQTRGPSVEGAVLGVGLNVARAPELPATPFVPAVGCLADCMPGRPPNLSTLLWTLLAELAEGFRSLCAVGVDALLKRYRAASCVVGERVRIYDETFGERALGQPWPEPLAQGEVVSIERDLSLRLAGRRQPVAKGRLAFEAACAQLGV